MKILRISYSELLFYEGCLSVDLTASQRIPASDRKSLIPVTGSVYANPVIEFTGATASGKTLTLKLLQIAFVLAAGLPLNSSPHRSALLKQIGSDPVDLQIHFFLDQNLYFLNAKISKRWSRITPTESELFIEDESLYVLNSPAINKSNWKMNPSEGGNDVYRLIYRRSEAGDLLSADVSLVISLINKSEQSLELLCYPDSKDPQDLDLYAGYIPAVVQYLDPSVKYLEIYRNDGRNSVGFRLKFKSRVNEIDVISFAKLKQYLSKGTIKGIELFLLSLISFQNGAYVFVDELENHLNIEIVKSLIRFFLNRSVNKNGGTLVFTTSNPKFIAELSRKDGAYIIHNSGLITCRNLSGAYSENGEPDNEGYFELENLLIRLSSGGSHSF